MKYLLDKSKLKDQFFLSGSQQFNMIKTVSESLAGRLGLVNLLGFSMRERNAIVFDAPFVPTEAYFTERKKELAEFSYSGVWNMVHGGCFQELVLHPEFSWHMF